MAQVEKKLVRKQLIKRCASNVYNTNTSIDEKMIADYSRMNKIDISTITNSEFDNVQMSQVDMMLSMQSGLLEYDFVPVYNIRKPKIVPNKNKQNVRQNKIIQQPLQNNTVKKCQSNTPRQYQLKTNYTLPAIKLKKQIYLRNRNHFIIQQQDQSKALLVQNKQPFHQNCSYQLKNKYQQKVQTNKPNNQNAQHKNMRRFKPKFEQARDITEYDQINFQHQTT